MYMYNVYTLVHVQCIYTCTCTTCVDDVVYMSVHYVHAYTCTCMHVYGIVSFEQPQLVSQNQGLLEKNLSLQESSAEVTNPSVVKHVHVHVYAVTYYVAVHGEHMYPLHTLCALNTCM